MFVIIDTHPIQYRAPVYRCLQQQFHIPVTVIYGTDSSVIGCQDREFGETFAWDTDLLSGYESIFLSKGSKEGDNLADKVGTRGLGRILKSVNPRAVLLTGYASLFHLEAFYQACRQKCPIVFRAETTDHAIKRNPTRRWVRDQILKRFYGRCSKLLYIGQHSYWHFKRLGAPEERLFFSPYCVDETTFQTDDASRNELRNQARELLGLETNQIVLLFSGKISERKGPDLIPRAIQLLPAEIRGQIAVLFLGSGAMKEDLKKIASIEPRIKVVFAGFQNQSKLSAYYHASDLLILPSQYGETWGLVVNEALHHGVPCVVSDAVGCAPDLIDIGKTGEIFKSEDVDDLVAAIRRAICLTNRKEVRDICRNKMKNYTVAKAAEGIAAAYYSVVRHA